MAQRNTSVGNLVKVRSYGKLRTLLGNQIEVAVPANCSITQLREAIIALKPDSAEVLRNARTRGCIGNSLVAETARVSDGDVVEFLPPVSGG